MTNTRERFNHRQLLRNRDENARRERSTDTEQSLNNNTPNVNFTSAQPRDRVPDGEKTNILSFIIEYWDKILVVITFAGAFGWFIVLNYSVSKVESDASENKANISKVESMTQINIQDISNLQKDVTYIGDDITHLNIELGNMVREQNKLGIKVEGLKN